MRCFYMMPAALMADASALLLQIAGVVEGVAEGKWWLVGCYASGAVSTVIVGALCVKAWRGDRAAVGGRS